MFTVHFNVIPRLLTQDFDVDDGGLQSVGVLRGQDVSSRVVAVAALDDGHGSGGGVGQGVFLSQLQHLVALGPEHGGLGFPAHGAVQNQV